MRDAQRLPRPRTRRADVVGPPSGLLSPRPMIEPLLELPAHLRKRLVNALKTELLVPPYEEAAVRAALGGDAAAAGARDALNRLNDRGIPGPAVALALEAAARAIADTLRPVLLSS